MTLGGDPGGESQDENGRLSEPRFLAPHLVGKRVPTPQERVGCESGDCNRPGQYAARQVGKSNSQLWGDGQLLRIGSPQGRIDVNATAILGRLRAVFDRLLSTQDHLVSRLPQLLQSLVERRHAVRIARLRCCGGVRAFRRLEWADGGGSAARTLGSGGELATSELDGAAGPEGGVAGTAANSPWSADTGDGPRGGVRPAAGLRCAPVSRGCYGRFRLDSAEQFLERHARLFPPIPVLI